MLVSGYIIVVSCVFASGPLLARRPRTPTLLLRLPVFPLIPLASIGFPSLAQLLYEPPFDIESWEQKHCAREPGTAGRKG